VLEPACGGGALIGGLLHAGHSPACVSACDVDAEWADYCHALYPAVEVGAVDFLGPLALDSDSLDVVLMNPPFEDNGHLRFVLRSLELAPVVIGIFPVSFEFSKERDRLLWSCKGVVTRRARLPERVDYGGDQSPSFDSVALRIERRIGQRPIGEQRSVNEEVWQP
jgi:predicted RNA methylase